MIKVIHYGFGVQGRLAVKLMLGKKNLKLVGVADVDPNLLGRDAGDVVGYGKTGILVEEPVKILSEIREGRLKADVVTHTTTQTNLPEAYEQIKPFIEMNLNVITTCEEVIYPWIQYPQLAKEIDSLAKKHGVRVMGTGVNPGFATEVLPLTLCGTCLKVSKIKVRRVVDFYEYKELRPKFFGITSEEFMEGVKNGIWNLGKNPFPGRIQTIHMIAACLGWKLDKADVKYEPVISTISRETPWGFVIEPGTTAGCKQIGSGFVGEEERIRIECFSICSPNPKVDGVDVSNTIWIDGEPQHVMEVKGGIVERGSFVTSIRLINVIPQVSRASPGLISPVDIPVALPLQ